MIKLIFSALFHLDLFIESDAPSRSLFDFSHESHQGGDHEVWGLGLHAVISPLRVPPQV